MSHAHRRFRLWFLYTLISFLFVLAFHRVWPYLSGWLPGPGKPESRRIAVTENKVALNPVESFRFESEAALAKWEQKIFKGQTVFQLMKENGPFLRMTSEDACSGLYMKTNHVATPDLFLSWKWRVHEFPEKEDETKLSNRSEDDFAARLYVIFLASNLFRSDVIEYVWDRTLPPGSVADSPYSDRIKLFVIRSGQPADADGTEWRQEVRNPLEDYVKLFGKAPKDPIGVLALMSDSDNTRTRASADFEEIVLGTKK